MIDKSRIPDAPKAETPPPEGWEPARDELGPVTEWRDGMEQLIPDRCAVSELLTNCSKHPHGQHEWVCLTCLSESQTAPPATDRMYLSAGFMEILGVWRHEHETDDWLLRQMETLFSTFPAPVQTAPPSAWQPIESAPKDADAVLLFKDGWGVQPGFWSERRWIATETQGLTGGGFGDGGPTHWQPLPSPPSPPGDAP